MMNNENALTVVDEFVLPTVGNPTEEIDDYGDDFDGLTLSFPRVKIPAGGVLQFEVPSDNPEEPDYKSKIQGVLLFNHATNAYWPAGSEFDMNTQPLCASVDGKTGFGEPGGACVGCPMNEYNTDLSGGKGKACKNMRSLYILCNGAAMPIHLSLPPTSLRPFSDFMSQVFLTRRRKPWSAVIEIGLRKEENGSNTYSVATFRKVGDFTGEKLAEVTAYAKAFREEVKKMLMTRAINTESRKEPNGVFEDNPEYKTTETADGFVVTGPETVNAASNDDLPL